MKPSNGFYVTEADTGQFHKWFSSAYNSFIEDEKKHISDTSVKNITFVMTESCNLNCTYCYQHHKSPATMTKEVAKQAVDFILDTNKTRSYMPIEEFPAVVLDFIGGEPLLNIEVMDYLVDYFKIRALELNHPWGENYMISISSNGILYKTPKVQKFIQKNLNRVSIGITIDGTKELHDSCRVFYDGSGSYDIVVDAVKLWVTQKNAPDTKVTLAPENLDYLVESIIHLFELGIENVPANVVFEDVWQDKTLSTKLYNELCELADRIIDEEWYKTHVTSLFSENIGTPMSEEDDQNWCGGDGKMLAIGTDGECYPCLRYMKYSLQTPDRKPLVIGNIWDGLVTKENHQGLFELSVITRSSQSLEKCMTCPVNQGCSWCSAYNYDVYGTANKRAIFHCEMHQARSLANVYYWNKLYNKLGILKVFEMHLPKEWAEKIISSDEYEKLLNLSQRRI